MFKEKNFKKNMNEIQKIDDFTLKTANDRAKKCVKIFYQKR